jgi:hypothetical protein
MRQAERGVKALFCMAFGFGLFFYGVCAFWQGASKKKEKENKEQKQKDNPGKKQPTDFFFFFKGAPCVGCGPSVDMPPHHVGTRSWLWGLPLRASSL